LKEQHTIFATFKDKKVKRSIDIFCDVDAWGPGMPSLLGMALEMVGFNF
jgi:hypothetical protein